MKTKLYSGNHEIVDSNTVILFDKNSNLLINATTETFDFMIEIIFTEDESGKIAINRNVDVENNKVLFTCVNFKNIFGTNTTTPLNIATVEDRALYLHLYVSLMEDGIRRVNYTLFLEGGV